jgi:hypothetical protein
MIAQLLQWLWYVLEWFRIQFAAGAKILFSPQNSPPPPPKKIWSPLSGVFDSQSSFNQGRNGWRVKLITGILLAKFRISADVLLIQLNGAYKENCTYLLLNLSNIFNRKEPRRKTGAGHCRTSNCAASCGRLRLKCDGTCAETRFCFAAFEMWWHMRRNQTLFYCVWNVMARAQKPDFVVLFLKRDGTRAEIRFRLTAFEM